MPTITIKLRYIRTLLKSGHSLANANRSWKELDKTPESLEEAEQMAAAKAGMK